MRLFRTIGLFGAVVMLPGMLAGPTDSAAVRNVGRAVPRLSAVSPVSGPRAGGNIVVVQGKHLNSVGSVAFGSKRTTEVEHISANRLAVTAPAHPIGTVNVRLVSPSGRSSPSTKYAFGTTPKLNESTATLIDPERGELSSVSCPTEDFCAAVDVHDLVMWRSGQPLQRVPAKKVNTVSCAGPDVCIAGATHHVLVWNGVTWRTVRDADSPHANFFHTACAVGSTTCIAANDSVYALYRAGAVHFFARQAPLSGPVSCATATFCMAVKGHDAYRFDGTSWTSAGELPKAGGFFGGDIACPTTTFCLAGGAHAFSVYDGTAWHAAPRVPLAFTEGVDCSSADDCVIASQNHYVVFTGTGPSARHRIPQAARVTAVSCVPGGSCAAIDRHAQLLRHTDAGWSAPVQFSPLTGHLTDVSCVTLTWCTAVDGSGNALRGAGSSWSAPEPIDDFRVLIAVSCVKGRVCAAVDLSGYAVTYQDGKWSRPQRIDRNNELSDVSCASRTRCVAADLSGRVLTWNGSRWSKPKKIAPHAALSLVECPTTQRCFALAESLRSRPSTWYALRDRKWRARRLPHGRFEGISCLRPSFCVVAMDIGFEYRIHGAWSRPVKPQWRPVLGIGCINEHACVGVGKLHVAGARTVALAVNGASVRRARMASPPTAISCVPNQGCVGITDSSAETLTLK